MERIARLFLVTGIFAFAMGLLETIVVVYLRQLYYPRGFDFPLVEFSPFLFKIEFLREFVTVVMLVTVGILAGRTRMKSFAFFLYAFAVWDISYYIGLKFLLGWPASLLTWDILFLIPVVWVGPVLAPVICSLAMILLAVYIIRIDEKGIKPVMSKLDWSFQIAGSVIVFISFIWDYSMMLFRGNFLSRLSTLSTDKEFHAALASYVPVWFNWYLFSLGMIIILYGIVKMILRYHRYSR